MFWNSVFPREAEFHIWNLKFQNAEVAKLADAPDLGSGVERRASSSLALGTKRQWSVASGQLSVKNNCPGHSSSAATGN
jgi:hypothetical protein